MNINENETLGKAAPDSPADNFIRRVTNQFREGITGMLAECSDTFAFDFQLSDVPGWELRAEAEKAGLPAETMMSVVVLVRPKETADGLLDALQEARELLG